MRGNAGDDSLKGDDGDDNVQGGGGDDPLRGGRPDALTGGPGADRAAGGEGNDTLTAARRAWWASTPGHPAGQCRQRRALRGAAEDTLIGGDGADAMAGGAGRDTVDYSDATEGVTVRLDDLANDGEPASATTSATTSRTSAAGESGHLHRDRARNDLDGGTGEDFVDGRRGATRSAAGPPATSSARATAPATSSTAGAAPIRDRRPQGRGAQLRAHGA